MQCDLPGISIYYESVGKGRPFLLLHGSPGDQLRARHQVEPAFRRLSGWQRVYPDLPGHGKTPGAARIQDIDDYLGVLVEFVDEVFHGGRFTLGGISFGSYLALGLTHKRGDRLDGLLLSVPEVYFSPREERREQAEHRTGTPRTRAEADERPTWKNYSEDTAWLQGLPWKDLSFDLYHRPETFRAPALFLFGRQDARFRYQEYWKLLSDFPGATFAVLDRAGHMLWADRRGVANALVKDWLGRVEDWASKRSEKA